MLTTLLSNVVSAVVFAVLGITVFLLTFVVVDRLTPYTLWREIIDEHNTALAVLIGAVALGMSIIIAAAIH
jgi:putative membrane protein